MTDEAGAELPATIFIEGIPWEASATEVRSVVSSSLLEGEALQELFLPFDDYARPSGTAYALLHLLPGRSASSAAAGLRGQYVGARYLEARPAEPDKVAEARRSTELVRARAPCPTRK